MRYPDWGERCPRWQGIRSERIEISGNRVHYLCADAAADAPPDAPTHLLIHPFASSATIWLDAIAHLRVLGPVVAPDLVGSVTGDTPAPHHRAARIGPNTRLVGAFARALGLRGAVAHGWSMGGLVALLAADLAPDRIGRLVLTAPTLPGPISTGEAAAWHTAGRAVLTAGPPTVRGLLRLLGPKLVTLKAGTHGTLASDHVPNDVFSIMGGDPTRISPEMAALWAEQAQLLGLRAQRLGDLATALASVIAAMTFDRRPVQDAIERARVPVLLLWGDQDRLIPRPVIDDVAARRPDWTLHILPTVGHLSPAEVPRTYANAIADRLLPHA